MFSKKDPTPPAIEDDEIDTETQAPDSDGYSADAESEEPGTSPLAPKPKRKKQIIPPLPQDIIPVAVLDVTSPLNQSKPPTHPRSPSALEHPQKATSSCKPSLGLYPDDTRGRTNLLFSSSKKDTCAPNGIFVNSTNPSSPHVSKKPS